MKTIDYISRRFGSKYIVWLKDINQWIQFEEPAFFVFEMLVRSRDIQKIVKELKGIFEVDTEELFVFASRIKERIDNLIKTEAKSIPEFETKEVYTHIADSEEEDINFISHTYRVKGKLIRIQYQTELYEYYIHHAFSHLVCTDDSKADYIFRVFSANDQHLLEKVFPKKKNWTSSDIPMLKRRFFIEFGNAIYDKKDSDWMSIIHGSCVTNGENTAIFISSTGAGKSTLTALMQKEGFEFVSDDYVPVDKVSGLIYPFPAAISIKKGSIYMLSGFYPQLSEIPEKQFKLINKSVRFLPPDNHKNFNYSPVKPTHIFFIKYQEDCESIIQELEIPDAFALFNNEAWISSSPDHAENFIDWFSELKFYNLTYGDNYKIIDLLKGIINVK